MRSILFAFILLASVDCLTAQTEIQWQRLNPPSSGSGFGYSSAKSTLYISSRSDGTTAYKGQEIQWNTKQQMLPYNVHMGTVVTADGHIILATREGIYKSVDNGITWTQSNNGFGSNLPDIDEILITSSNTIFLASESVWRSTDQGDTWTAVSIGTSGQKSQALAVDQAGNIYAGVKEGIFRSSDNGNNWTQLTPLAQGVVAHSIVVGNGLILVATGGAGVLRSSDDGATWTSVTETLGTGYIPSLNLVGVPQVGRLIVAAVYSQGIYSSFDGLVWTKLENAPTTNVEDVFSVGWKLYLGGPDGVFVGELQASVNEKNSSSVVARENPFSVSLELTGSFDGLTEISVVNSAGVEYFSGGYTGPIDTRAWPAGVYLIDVQGSEPIKVVKQ